MVFIIEVAIPRRDPLLVESLKLETFEEFGTLDLLMLY